MNRTSVNTCHFLSAAERVHNGTDALTAGMSRWAKQLLRDCEQLDDQQAAARIRAEVDKLNHLWLSNDVDRIRDQLDRAQSELGELTETVDRWPEHRSDEALERVLYLEQAVRHYQSMLEVRRAA